MPAVASGRSVRRVAARILEGEHLLLHDVGELADRALEQRRVLDDRHANFLVAVRSEQLARDAFEPLPAGNVRRQDIVHPARRLDLLLRHSIASRSAVFTEVSDLTEPSASIKNRVPSRPARRGITIGRSSTCALHRRRQPENHSQRRHARDRAHAAGRAHVEHQSLARGIVDLDPRRLAELQAHAHFAGRRCTRRLAALPRLAGEGLAWRPLGPAPLSRAQLLPARRGSLTVGWRHRRRNDFARRCAV